MGGVFRHRVNRSWNKAFVNISAAVFFWEWLQFFNDHPSFSFIAYGTGKTQSGEVPPAAWLNWDPQTSGTIPWGDNSWFVVNADLSSGALDGSATQQWQAKFQVTSSSGFDDCNVADVDYDWEATTYCCCLRASAYGGWDETTLDFAPTGGQDASNNRNIIQDANNLFGLHIISDDDTIWWRGACVSSSLPVEAVNRSRGGYLGMLNRKDESLENPFYFMAGRMYNETANAGYRAIIRCDLTTLSTSVFRRDYAQWGTSNSWPSYSLRNGNKVDLHRGDTWDSTSLQFMPIDPLGDAVNWAIKIAQWESPHYDLLGELRMVAKTGFGYDFGVRYGSNNEWLQMGFLGLTNSGIGMKWPEGIVNDW